MPPYRTILSNEELEILRIRYQLGGEGKRRSFWIPVPIMKPILNTLPLLIAFAVLIYLIGNVLLGIKEVLRLNDDDIRKGKKVMRIKG